MTASPSPPADAAPAGPPHQSPGRVLMDMDPRVKLLTALFLGPLIWRLGPVGTGIMTLVMIGGAAVTTPASVFGPAAMRGNAVFLVLWAAAKTLFDVWGGAPFQAALADSALFAARLASLIFLGLVLAAVTSPRQMGAALAWALRPVLGRRAWKAALALALLVHSLPLVWTAGATIRGAMRRRCPGLPFSRAPGLFATALLRAVSLTAQERTLAVAARNLDRPEAWRPVFPHPWQGATAGLVAVVLTTVLVRTGL